MTAASLQIRTPEGIVFSQQLAGPVARFLAWLIDAACIAALMAGLGPLFAILGFISPGLGVAIYTIFYFVLSLGYGIAWEWFWRGQTIGKRLFGLRVVDVAGFRLQFNQIVTRNLLRLVDALPVAYFVGGIAAWFNPRVQRLGDIAANTVVIRQPRIAEPYLEQIQGGKFNSLLQHPHLGARLRQQVTPAEAATLLEALLRRNELDAIARVELFGDLAAYFRQKVAFPPEATDGIADEQYLRNLADIVFRARLARPAPPKLESLPP